MAWQVSKRVWSHAQNIKSSDKVMLLALADKADENGICWPKFDTSYETLADMVGVNRRSAIRIIDNLCEAGHVLKAETVGRGNSNIFVVLSGLESIEISNLLTQNGVTGNTIYTPKMVLPVTPNKKEMVLSVTQNGVTGNTNNGLNGVTGNTHPNMKNPSNPTVSDADLKKMSLKLIEVCGYADPKFVSDSKLKECSVAIKQLVEWGATVELIGEFSGYWWGDDPPTFKQVVDYWGKFLEKKKSKRVANKSSPSIDKSTYEQLQQQSQQEIFNPLA